MAFGRFAGSPALLAGLVLVGCTTPKATFMQIRHRENYAIQDQEVLRLRFYISREILARNVAEVASASSVVVVAADTPGAATEVGTDWIRVSFRQGSPGVYFLAVVTVGGDSAYWLATEVEGEPGLRALKDLDRKVLRTPDGAFELIYGADARLLVSSEDMQALIATRTHVPGRITDSN